MFRKLSYQGGYSSGQLRLFFTLAIAIALLIPTVAAYAQDEVSDSTATAALQPSGDICVIGEVIDWEENRIETDGDFGSWEVVATPVTDGVVDEAGSIPPSELITADSDDEDKMKSYQFKFEDGLYPGTWEFRVFYDGLIGDWEPVTPDAFQVPMDYEVGPPGSEDNCVRIRFKLREVASVIAIKIDADHSLLEDWTIFASPGAGNYYASRQDEKTDVNGEASFRLTPGLWIFTERPPEDADFDTMPIIPKQGSQELLIESAKDRDIDPNTGVPAPYRIRFKNEVDNGGCIEVIKYDVAPDGAEFPDPYFPLSGWAISVLRADGSEATYGYTNAEGKIKFEDLPYGPYTIVEEKRSGWDSVTPSSYDVTLVDDTCQIVEFYNGQVPETFCIEGRKVDANGHYGIPDWEIKASTLNVGGYEPDNVFTNGLGEYRFDLPAKDYRMPGAKYRVCEESQDGWLPHTSTCFDVVLPQYPGQCVKVPDFVNQQIGHTESGADSGWSSSGAKCSQTHTVQKGEYLSGIARTYNVSYYSLRKANPNIYNPNVIYSGQKICIP
jgi:hypothetical protein